MSTKVMHTCWDLQLPLPKKMLLVSLADQANDDGVCAPAPDSTARRCCMGRSTMFRALDWLEDRGYIRRHGTDRRRKTYLLTPQLGRFDPSDTGESVVPERDHRSPGAGLPKSPSGTTVVPERDYRSPPAGLRSGSSSPPVTPSPSGKDKEEERGARAREGRAGKDEQLVPVPGAFRPPALVADRLAKAGLPRTWEPYHLEHFIAHHEGKGTLRRLSAWPSEFVSWMIREHKQFAPAKTEKPLAPPPTPEQQLAADRRQRLMECVGDLRTARRLRVPPAWTDHGATSVLAELGGFERLRDLDQAAFEEQVKEFARRCHALMNGERGIA